MQFFSILTLVSLTITGAVAAPGYYTPTPTTPDSCSTSSSASSAPTISLINQQNVCQSGNPYCCSINSSVGGHSCDQMGNSTVNCDSTVLCCNDNGSGTQICTNSLTIVIM